MLFPLLLALLQLFLVGQMLEGEHKRHVTVLCYSVFYCQKFGINVIQVYRFRQVHAIDFSFYFRNIRLRIYWVHK
jgi:hypothetical protein